MNLSMPDLLKADILDVIPTPYGYSAFIESAGKVFVVSMNRIRGMELQYALEQRKGERPYTHEFVSQLLDGLDCKVARVIINHVDNGTFFTRIIAEMENELGKKIVEVDARPSDTLSLALRAHAPVFIKKAVLDSLPDMSEAYGKIRGK